MTALAAYFFASGTDIDWWRMLAMALGTGLVIGSGCVFNNYIDRDIDAKMARTKKRAMVTGSIPVRNAMIFGAVLAIIGFWILIAYTNIVTVLLGAIGLFFYVVVYGVAKRRSVHGTLVGTIPGATPTMAGYCAVTGQIDAAAVSLFLIMLCWQMAHFYAISIYRKQDYKHAKLPISSVVRGIEATKRQIIYYIGGFIAADLLLFIYGYVGLSYTAVMTVAGIWWLLGAVQSESKLKDKDWGKKVFLSSLSVLTLFSLMLVLNGILP